MKSSFKNYDDYLYSDDGYHLYVGITKDKEIASKIKKLYEKDGYNIYVKENIIDNPSFLSVSDNMTKL